MPLKSKIPHRNQNHTGWWVFIEVQQWVSDRQRKLTLRSKCPVWENTRILRAKNRVEAYKKAIKMCTEGAPSRTNSGEWRFAGLALLLPIYEDIADGSEIIWTDREKKSVKTIRNLVKQKKDLSVFNDKEN